MPDPKVLFQGFVKTYMDAVDRSKGLTTVKPSCTKAISAAAAKPTKELITAAITALNSHVKAVKEAKENTTPPNKAKADAFAKSIEDITKKLKDQIPK
jgi:hypothetical protein